jgi:hypothetical protein
MCHGQFKGIPTDENGQCGKKSEITVNYLKLMCCFSICIKIFDKRNPEIYTLLKLGMQQKSGCPREVS